MNAFWPLEKLKPKLCHKTLWKWQKNNIRMNKHTGEQKNENYQPSWSCQITCMYLPCLYSPQTTFLITSRAITLMKVSKICPPTIPNLPPPISMLTPSLKIIHQKKKRNNQVRYQKESGHWWNLMDTHITKGRSLNTPSLTCDTGYKDVICKCCVH